MRYIDADSSTINKIGYDPVNEILEIEFSKGSVYTYADVPHSVAINLIFNPSQGAYFMANIQKCPDIYKCEKIR